MIYVVEDDANIRELVVYTLLQSGYQAEGFEKPSEFRTALKAHEPELVLLDIMLPEEDGLSLLKFIKESDEQLPVIMLTAKSAEVDKVVGLDAGADDYMAKPFGMMELLARIRSVLRRSAKKVPEEDVLSLGSIHVDIARRKVETAEGEVKLTNKEYEMLCCLIRNREIVISRDKLLNSVWGYEFDGENRTVDVHIRSLRKKLGESAKYIHTVRGYGYKAGEI